MSRPQGSEREICFVYVGTLDFRGRLQKEITTLQQVGFRCRLLLGNIGEREVDASRFAFPIEVAPVPAYRGKLAFHFKTLWFGWKTGRMLAESDCETVICLGLEALPAGIFAKRKRPGLKVVFDSNELHLEAIMSRVKRLLWRPWQRLGIRAADAILHAEPNRMDYFKRKHGGRDKPQAVLENFPRHYSGNGGRERFSEKRVRVLYLGALGKDRYTEELVEIGRALGDRISLDLVGFATPEFMAELESKHGMNPSEHVRILPPVAYEEIPALLSGYDIGLAFYMHTGLNNYFCAPNKIYDYFMGGMPVITNSFPGLKKVVEEGRLGACIDEVSPASFERALDRIIDGRMWENITEEVRWKYSWDAQEEEFVRFVAP
ncbi:MAG: glycosyltransferase [Verrucomicrobiota bacterium]